jgi:hypothetical protein
VLDDEVDRVEVRLPLPAARNLNEPCGLQLLETQVVVPGITQEERVRRLRADRQVGILEDEIRQLGEPVQRDRICAVDFDVLFDLFKSVGDVIHRLER